MTINLSSDTGNDNSSASPHPYRMSTRYLWLSLVAALVPLLSFAALYDGYFSQLVTRITDERLATRMAATENEFSVYLKERQYELATLADQFDDPRIFTQGGAAYLPRELRDLLTLQAEHQTLYGIAFFDAQQNLVWTFPEDALTNERYTRMRDMPVSRFDNVELIGPEPHSWSRPPALLMRGDVQTSTLEQETRSPSIALILRFNTLTAIPRTLQVGGVFKPLISVPDGRTYDIVGQPVDSTQKIITRYQMAPGWTLQLVQNQELVEPPSAQMRYWLILLVIGTAAALLIIHLAISRRLKRQVDTLVHSVEQVAAGDLESPIAQVSSDEMSRLTQSIERMRHQLKQVIRSTLEIERQASLGQVAAGLAHDIRNPLTTMHTTLQALVRREPNPEHREMLLMLDEEIDRVNDVIGNLLNFARPRDPQRELVALPELFDSLTALVNASARRQNVFIDIDCPEALSVYADTGQLRQILMNLTLNALQAMHGGGRITYSARQTENETTLCVRDNGPGMPEEILSRATEPFFTTKETGTGLGLAICQTLAVRNGAQLSIETAMANSDSSKEITAGTRVTLRFPHSDNQPTMTADTPTRSASRLSNSKHSTPKLFTSNNKEPQA
ncbi:sensor histidine kinase [Marinobacterium lutimaris]|uniref:histidine kinase n=1 Tax=Marinobacterium lutimaris TaxID=568106 RepID=A0A1H5Y301_9GAMM|nr:HAMP domain-containing sensor histidine kinase [Marinobacterium lutimaris]SEG18394.1 two-component system, NtrC family, sensor histidine kinase AtoS [Marinobacterium lutimaris]